MRIVWTDVYNGIEDTITFDGVVNVRKSDPGNLLAPGTIAMSGTGTAQGSRAGWKSCNPGIDEIPDGTVSATFEAIIDASTIAVSAFANEGTSLAGVWAPPILLPIAGGTLAYPEDPVVGDLCPRKSRGTATVTPFGVPPRP